MRVVPLLLLLLAPQESLEQRRDRIGERLHRVAQHALNLRGWDDRASNFVAHLRTVDADARVDHALEEEGAAERNRQLVFATLGCHCMPPA